MSRLKRLPKHVESRITKKFTHIAVQQIFIAIGAFVVALGYTLFQVPFNIAAGGVTGLAIVINKFTGFPQGAIYMLCNIPLLVLGFFTLGRWRFLISTVLAAVIFSVSTDLLNHILPQVLPVYPITDDPLLAAIYAGIVFGLGTGTIYRWGGTIGGTAIPARIIYNKTGFPLSQSFLFTDLSIILLAGLTFDWEVALLAILTLLIIGMVSDLVIEGPSQVRTLTIITAHPEPIRSAIINELQRGVSHWHVTGGYSGTERTMLYCTVLRSRVYDVKYLVSQLDPDAFMVVGVSQQTWGGYNAPRLDKR